MGVALDAIRDQDGIKPAGSVGCARNPAMAARYLARWLRVRRRIPAGSAQALADDRSVCSQNPHQEGRRFRRGDAWIECSERGLPEDCLQRALRFHSSPGNRCANGHFPRRRTARGPALAMPLRPCRNGVCGISEFACPIKCMGGTVKAVMVLPRRIELRTSPLPRECSTAELRQRRARVIRRN